MPTQPYLLTSKVAAILLSIAVALMLLSAPGILLAAGPAQDGSDTPEIAEPECSFGMDYNDDGELDEPFDAERDQYVLQETAVAGGCTFQLNAPVAGTLVVESDLQDWQIQLELQREPNPPKTHTLYPGAPQVADIEGRMEVTANFRRGDTPRSMKPRTLDGRYNHQVQIPEEFRLLEITVTTPEGLKDRLERNVQSASGTYIKVRRQLSDEKAKLPGWASALAAEWLDEGYPQVAESVIAQALETDEGGSGGSNWWMWALIAHWVVILTAAAGLVVFFQLWSMWGTIAAWAVAMLIIAGAIIYLQF